jgi:hydroxymethylbilane synthase
VNKLRIATRASSLAIIQTQIVIAALKKHKPDISFEIVEIKSKGDIDRKKPLWKLSETGFFTAAVEDALRENKADIATHSYKDLPIAGSACGELVESTGLVTAAVLDRKFCQDCLVCKEKVNSLKDLPKGAKIGTSSLRRRAQLLRLRPDVICEPIRGNVPTRINMVERGEYDGVILAYAGIERLGLAEKVSFCLEPTEFVPAPAQGAIAVQARADDSEIINLLTAINDKDSRITADTERFVLHKTGAGCHAPAGVFAEISGEDIIIHAFVSNKDGTEFIKRRLQGPVKFAQSIAKDLADELLQAGDSELLENE